MLAVSRVAAVLPLAPLLAPAVARADDASMFVNVGGSIGVGISGGAMTLLPNDATRCNAS